MGTMKIQSVTYRIVLSVIVAWAAGVFVWLAMIALMSLKPMYLPPLVVFGVPFLLISSVVTAIAFWRLTPPLAPDGHTRCGKCGYILKGLTEPRCSECGERI